MKSIEQNGFMEAWNRSKPFLVTALKKGTYGGYDIDDLWAMINDGRAIFYPVQNGAAVFRVEVYPHTRRLAFWLIGGEVGDGRAKLDAVVEAAEFLAKEHECDGIELIGQKGWERVLKPYGYKHKGVVLTKERGGD